MPSAIVDPPHNGITKFTNCRLVRGDALVPGDLWVSAATGKIIHSQAEFYDQLLVPGEVIDLGGRIVSPGLIDVQLNGAYGFNFSTMPETAAGYAKEVKTLNRQLVQTGVTSYMPTVTSQTAELYKAVLPHLGPNGHLRTAQDGSESLGAHVEGPFLSPTKNGIHNTDVFRQANEFADLEECYGAANLTASEAGKPAAVRKITAAPEIASMTQLIPELRSRDIIFSVGHSEATYEEASRAVEAGATMITHLFNAMRPLHHRNPGVFGVLGNPDVRKRPFFGIIADGIHLHPTTIKIALNAHPDGFILVTDAMHLVGLPDGAYRWANGNDVSSIVKKGSKLVLEGSDTIAGSSITLIECVNNLMEWTGASIPQALRTVTATPAAMLSLDGVKGTLEDGADADLVIFSEESGSVGSKLRVDEVWKFGARVWGGGQ
ncbi:related to N-acetylglucosamine-6-phosphate deacetylase [Cephalotrichum gorgonifer]|uniref:N-acetylglucosamine-6-phosphate deacetylase n=1 Tax=Cephalotrichum gorgonifer TaxID=2041049 RepID=A0AAE8SY78_9PEZI|nr:related to N-acetylglucosamine-6-phosphate deacetylase [Cephalotrichum gorgonifer]